MYEAQKRQPHVKIQTVHPLQVLQKEEREKKRCCLVQLIQMLKSRQNNLFTGLFDFSCKKYFVQDRINLVEIKHQIQFTNVPKELV